MRFPCLAAARMPALCVALAYVGSAGAAPAPNVIFIMTDDLGPGEFKQYDNLQGLGQTSKIDTPNIDRLASQGMTFTNAHAATTLCAPTRAAVMSGAPTWQTNIRWGLGSASLRPGQQSLGELMQAAGYKTAIMGKGHLGGEIYAVGSNNAAGNSLAQVPNMDFDRPLKDGMKQHGYDYTMQLLGGHQQGPYLYWENDLATTIDANGNSTRIINATKVANTRQWNAGYDDGVTEIWPGASGWGVDDWNTRDVPQVMLNKAVGFMNDTLAQDPQQPFFLHYNTIAGHWPYVAPDEINVDLNSDGLFDGPGERHQIDGYNGTGPAPNDRGTESMQMVNVSDAEVGVLLSYLEMTDDPRNPGSKLVDNTVVVYTSDNGGIGPNYFHLQYGFFDTEEWDVYRHDSTSGLFGSKGAPHEGGHRVPFIVQWPGQVEAGAVLDQRISNIDMFATLAGLTGQSLTDQAQGSHNLLPAFMGERDDSDPIRSNLVVEDTGGASDNNIARNLYYEGDFKLHLGLQTSNPTLFEAYDLAVDPGETNNLVNSTDPAVQQKIAAMRDRFVEERNAVRMAPVLVGRNDTLASADLTGLGDISVEGRLEASGLHNGDLDLNRGGEVRLVAGAAVATTQTTASQDISIRSAKPATNFNAQRVGLGQTGSDLDGVARGALEFDISTLAIPQDAAIESASLTLTIGFNWNLVTASSSPTIEVYLLPQAFNEAQATWNQASAGFAWSAPGGGVDPGLLVGTISGFDPDVITLGDQLTLSSPALTQAVSELTAGGDLRLLLKYDSASEANNAKSAIWIDSLQLGALPPTLSVAYALPAGERDFRVSGDFTQREGSRLVLSLGNGTTAGDDYDRLSVDANMRLLGGELRVEADPDFLPAAGAAYNILSFANLSGQFSSVSLPELPLGLKWDDSQLLTTGTIAIAPVLAGDYNDDGVVDAADYTLWRDSVDAPAGTLLNDVDGGPIGEAQYATWRLNFGQTTATALAASAVPEPASIVLALGVFAALSWTCRCGQRLQKGPDHAPSAP